MYQITTTYADILVIHTFGTGWRASNRIGRDAFVYFWLVRRSDSHTRTERGMTLILNGRCYSSCNTSRSAFLNGLLEALATFLISLFQLRHNFVQFVSVRLS